MFTTAELLQTVGDFMMENDELMSDYNAAHLKKGSAAKGRALRVLGVLIIALLSALCLSVIAPKAAGYDAFVVVSGSMEPEYPVGCVVYSKQTDPSTLSEGDVIVFNDELRGTSPITHRVVSNDTSTQTLITKGDANDHEDINPVTYDNVIGKVKAHAPCIGYITNMLTRGLGRIVTALLFLEGWLLLEVGRRLS